MSDPFAIANAALFEAQGNVDGVISQGAASYSRRVLLSLDVESVDLNSGAVSRVTTVQFPRVGGLRPKLGSVLIGSTIYTLENRISDDGYAETWRVTS